MLYHNPQAPITQLTSSVFLDNIPEDLLTIGSGPFTAHRKGLHVRIESETMAAFPKHMTYEDASLAVVYTPFASYNQGHFMFDEAFALHQSLCEFGLLGKNPQIYVTELNNAQMYLERMHVVSNRPVVSLSNGSKAAERHHGEGLLFQNLLIGISPYSYGMRDARRKSLLWQLFKSSYLENLQLSDLTPRKHQIVFIVKHGNRGIVNMMRSLPCYACSISPL